MWARAYRTALSSRLLSICSRRSGSIPRCTDIGGDRALTAAGHESLHRAPGTTLRVDGACVDGEPPRIDPGDIEQLGDQAGDPVGIGLNGLDHEALLLVGEAVPPSQQGGRNPFTPVRGDRSSWAIVEMRAAFRALGAASAPHRRADR